MYGNGLSQSVTVLPTSGDLAIFADSQPVYKAPATRAASHQLPLLPLVPPGQFVIADLENNNSLGETPSAVQSASFGVAIDLNNNGVSDYIRWVHTVGQCDFVAFEVEEPECGQHAIVDLFAKCFECNKTISIDVEYFSNETDGFSKENRGYRYTFSYTPVCDTCDGCSNEVNADEVMCGLYNAINLGERGDWDITVNGELQPGAIDLPFVVDQLYNDSGPGSNDTTFEFDLAPSDSAATCVNCINYTAIKGISSAGTPAINTTFDPALYVDDGGTNYSRAQHLEHIAAEITLALDGKGTARVQKCVGKCCNFKLEVNTCITDFVLIDDADSPIAATTTSNPFTNVDVFQECDDCDNVPGTTTFPIGWRFRPKSQYLECDCLGGNYAQAEYAADLKVFPRFGFSDGGYHVVRRQEPQEPAGQGLVWQQHEYETLKQGHGHNVVRGLRGGLHHTPFGDDAVNHIATKCNQQYCIATATVQHKEYEGDGGGYQIIDRVFHILIEDGASTLVTSLNTAFADFVNATCSDVAISFDCGFGG